MGADGHIVFNELNTTLVARTHYIDLDESTRKYNAHFFNGN